MSRTVIKKGPYLVALISSLDGKSQANGEGDDSKKRKIEQDEEEVKPESEEAKEEVDEQPEVEEQEEADEKGHEEVKEEEPSEEVSEEKDEAEPEEELKGEAEEPATDAQVEEEEEVETESAPPAEDLPAPVPATRGETRASTRHLVVTIQSYRTWPRPRAGSDQTWSERSLMKN